MPNAREHRRRDFLDRWQQWALAVQSGNGQSVACVRIAKMRRKRGESDRMPAEARQEKNRPRAFPCRALARLLSQAHGIEIAPDDVDKLGDLRWMLTPKILRLIKK